MTSNSSKNVQCCPINEKASFETRLQASILRQVREVHDLVTDCIDREVILRQHVMSNFLSSVCLLAIAEIPSSETPEHLKRLSSLSDAQQFPIIFNAEEVTSQPSNLRHCSIEKF